MSGKHAHFSFHASYYMYVLTGLVTLHTYWPSNKVDGNFMNTINNFVICNQLYMTVNVLITELFY